MQKNLFDLIVIFNEVIVEGYKAVRGTHLNRMNRLGLIADKKIGGNKYIKILSEMSDVLNRLTMELS